MHLWKIIIKSTNAPKECGGIKDNDLISVTFKRRNNFWRGYGAGYDDFCGSRFVGRLDGGEHGHAGGNAIIYDNCGHISKV